MANSNLQNKTYQIPPNIKQELNDEFNLLSPNTEENKIKRLKYLVNNDNITYYEMKRLKNYFDNCDTSNEIDMRLNGGNKLKQWVDNTLDADRNLIQGSKEDMKNMGAKNQFKKPKSNIKKIDNKDVILEPMKLESNKKVFFTKEQLNEIIRKI